MNSTDFYAGVAVASILAASGFALVSVSNHMDTHDTGAGMASIHDSFKHMGETMDHTESTVKGMGVTVAQMKASTDALKASTEETTRLVGVLAGKVDGLGDASRGKGAAK